MMTGLGAVAWAAAAATAKPVRTTCRVNAGLTPAVAVLDAARVTRSRQVTAVFARTEKVKVPEAAGFLCANVVHDFPTCRCSTTLPPLGDTVPDTTAVEPIKAVAGLRCAEIAVRAGALAASAGLDASSNDTAASRTSGTRHMRAGTGVAMLGRVGPGPR